MCWSNHLHVCLKRETVGHKIGHPPSHVHAAEGHLLTCFRIQKSQSGVALWAAKGESKCEK